MNKVVKSVLACTGVIAVGTCAVLAYLNRERETFKIEKTEDNNYKCSFSKNGKTSEATASTMHDAVKKAKEDWSNQNVPVEQKEEQ